MLPDTLVGLVVFAAGAGPGYLYVRLSQVRAPRYKRTALEEAAEFVVFGALASGLAVLSVLALGKVSAILDVDAIGRGPAMYATTHPGRALLALVVTLALSYGGVFGVTRLVHPSSADISPGESAWYAVFRRMVPDEHGVYGTVELDDGTAVAGLIVAYTVEADEAREIVLSKPVNGSLLMRTKANEQVTLPDTSIIIPGSRVRAIGARYTPLSSAPQEDPQPTRGKQRRKRWKKSG